MMLEVGDKVMGKYNLDHWKGVVIEVGDWREDHPVKIRKETGKIITVSKSGCSNIHSCNPSLDDCVKI